MNKETLYQEWITQKKKVNVGDHFADSVMAKIHAGETYSKPSSIKITWSSLRFVKAALITAGLVGGLIRLAAILGLILGSCVEAQGGIL
jgi:hypothetical protein